MISRLIRYPYFGKMPSGSCCREVMTVGNGRWTFEWVGEICQDGILIYSNVAKRKYGKATILYANESYGVYPTRDWLPRALVRIVDA